MPGASMKVELLGAEKVRRRLDKLVRDCSDASACRPTSMRLDDSRQAVIRRHGEQAEGSLLLCWALVKGLARTFSSFDISPAYP